MSPENTSAVKLEFVFWLQSRFWLNWLCTNCKIISWVKNQDGLTKSLFGFLKARPWIICLFDYQFLKSNRRKTYFSQLNLSIRLGFFGEYKKVIFWLELIKFLAYMMITLISSGLRVYKKTESSYWLQKFVDSQRTRKNFKNPHHRLNIKFLMYPVVTIVTLNSTFNPLKNIISVPFDFSGFL